MGPIAAAPVCAVILIKEKYFKNKIMNFATEIYYHVMHRSNSKININVTLPKVNYAAKNPYIKLPPIINFIDSNR